MHQSLSESSGRPVNLEALFGRNASGAVYVLYSVHCKGAQSALATKSIMLRKGNLKVKLKIIRGIS